MKNILLLLFIGFAAISFAQSPPQAFNYSAVARDASSNPIASQTIGIQISILQASTIGTVQYQENHFVNTDAFGLFNLIVGGGSIQSGTMGTIDWSADNYYIKVGMDAAGGTSFLTMGTTQLLSVPYAIHSATADSIIGGGSVTGLEPVIDYESPYGFGEPIFMNAAVTFNVPAGKVLEVYDGDYYYNSYTPINDVFGMLYDDNPNIVPLQHDLSTGDYTVPVGQILVLVANPQCSGDTGPPNYMPTYGDAYFNGSSVSHFRKIYPESTVVSQGTLSACIININYVIKGFLIIQ